MGKFRVGDRVRRIGAHSHCGVYPGDEVVVAELKGEYNFRTGMEPSSSHSHAFRNYELVAAAQDTPAYTIEHVIPLIKDARQLDHATHIVCDRGGNTDLMEKMLRDVYAEIGEKVSRAVEVDA